MAKINILILFFSLFVFISTINECDDDIVYKEACSKLKPEGESQSCYYYKNTCTSVFLKCSDYTGSDKETCEGIDPHDNRYACRLNSENRCEQYAYQCSEGDNKGQRVCEYLSAGADNQRCYYDTQNNKCLTYYNNCEDAPQDKCDSNLPLDYSKIICYSEGSQCKSRKRKCREYLSNTDCWELDAETEGMKCIYRNWNCIPAYKHCEDYVGESIDESTCRLIRPFIKDSNDIDYSHKCVKEDNKCVKKQRECSNWEAIELITYCERITYDDNPYKKCFYNYPYCQVGYTDCHG